MTQKKNKWHKLILTGIFVIINIVVIAATAFNEFGNSANAAELSEVKLNWWMLVPASLCFAVAIFACVLKYVLMIRESSDLKQVQDRKQIWKTSWRVLMLGRYYDSVTPASIGGQPFQIYYMRKHSGLGSGHATSIPIFSMITSQVGFLVVAFCCFVSGEFFRENPALIVTSVIGFLFYAFWPVMVAGTTFFPKATSRFIQSVVKILAKMKLIKNRENALGKVESSVNKYACSVKVILKNKRLSIRVVLLSVVYNFLIATIPFFVLKAFGGDMDFFHCLATTVAVTAAVYFVPTPGNAGAAEGTFYAVFSSLSTGYVFWAMLVWRFFTYYSYVIVGPLIYLHMHIEKKRNQKPDEHKKGLE